MIVVLLVSLVQSVTEFLPISSSGHLVILHRLVSVQGVDAFRLDIAVHLGTLIAVIIAFRADLWRFLRAFAVSVLRRRIENDDARFAWWLLLATVAPGLLGAVFGERLETAMRAPTVVAVMLAVGGVVLWLADRNRPSVRTMSSVRFRDVAIVGLSQVLAFLPGVSRSGITIIAARFRNIERAAAVRLSFLLSVPIISAVAVQQTVIAERESISRMEWGYLAVGVLVAALVGYGVIRMLLRFLSHHSFGVFAAYRIAAALAIMLWAR